ncbi:hypothetical protein MNBD_PLANCTO02-2951 [hydrothermal vent metagenome]|uniref:Uncharacterized protein n=1 Tax=hydrothermal vent metagenome TaxID=652676 RepID=A0A3B1D4V3_9ZZZZ
MENDSSNKHANKQYSPFRTAVLISTVMLVGIYLWEMAKKEGILNSTSHAEEVVKKTNNKKTAPNNTKKKPLQKEIKAIFSSSPQKASTKKSLEPLIAQRPEPAPVIQSVFVNKEEKSDTPTVVVARKNRSSLEPVIAHVPHSKKNIKPTKTTSTIELGDPVLVQVRRVPLPAKKSDAEIMQEKAEAFLLQGKQSALRGDFAAAIKNYHQAVALGIRTAPLYYSMARAYAHRKDHSRAIEYYSRTIRISPRKASVFIARGVSYHAIRDYQKAIRDYTQAMTLRKNDALAYRNRSLAYRALGNKTLAVKDIETAKRLEKKD